jgi:hypothetical protein
MPGIQGLDEFEEFADDMQEIADGFDQARKNALRETAREFKGIIKEVLIASSTDQGGTFYSPTSPYSAGGENESTGSGMHLRNQGSWETEVVGSDMAVVYPNPEIRARARFMQYGTEDHGPAGDDPLYFKVGGKTIVMSTKKSSATGAFEFGIGSGSVDYDVDEEEYVRSGGDDLASLEEAFGNPALSNIESDVPVDTDRAGDRVNTEVSGVEPLYFIDVAAGIADDRDIFKENMGNEIDKLFEERGIQLEGSY